MMRNKCLLFVILLCLFTGCGRVDPVSDPIVVSKNDSPSGNHIKGHMDRGVNDLNTITPTVTPVSELEPVETVILSQNDSQPDQEPVLHKTSRDILQPVADGVVLYQNDTVVIDASHTSEGYVMIRYLGDADRAKLQMVIPNGTQYSYDLAGDIYQVFPLSGGDGCYHIEVLEHAYDDLYALAFAQDIDVCLNDPFLPFLYPNQYAWYDLNTNAVSLAIDLYLDVQDDLSFVESVYRYVINNITYDTELAENLPVGYIPDVDKTLTIKKGICFDYASLMTVMLRSQGVPTKLEVGYSGEAYHAWISVYLTDIGWVDNIIYFDGETWVLLDPTLGASNDPDAVKQYIGSGENYVLKYNY